MSWLDSLIPASQVSTQTSPYSTGNAQGAAASAYDMAGMLGQYNLGGQNLGQFQNLTQAGVNNPWAGAYQQGAGTAGGMGQAAGMQQLSAGSGLIGEGQGLYPSVQQILQTGFDPQNALYARTQQQVADQQAAQSAQSGVAGTPYGAGVAGQTLSNFNIDWQNQQLGREATAAGAAGGLAGTAANLQGAGANLQGQGINSYLQGSAQPYQTYAGINQNQLGLLNQANTYGQQAAAIPQMQQQDYAQYAQQAAQAQQAQAGLGLQKSQQEFSQANQIGQDIGQAFGGFTGGGFGGFGGGGGGFGGGGYGGYGGYGGFGQAAQGFGGWAGRQMGGYPGMGNKGSFGYGW